MEAGIVALAAVFALGALSFVWNARLRRGATRRLAALGFEPCDSEQPALQIAWRALVGATGRPRDLRVTSCTRRAAAWGMLHHFDVSDETHANDASQDRVHVGTAYSAYLLDLRDPATVHRGPVTLYVLPPGAAVMRALIRGVIAADAPGARLETSDQPWTRSILAAYGVTPGKLDDVVPPAIQEKLARAADHGFLRIHLADGKAGFEVLPARRNVDAEWTYLSEWV